MGLLDYIQSLNQQPPNQSQINQAVMNSSSPMMSMMSQAQAAQNPAPAMMIARAPAQVQKPKITATPELSETFRSYMPQPILGQTPEASGYIAQAKQSLADQQKALGGLDEYINQMAAKPRDPDYSPLAAFIDNVTGSKFAPVAEKMAPMSEDDRDKMLFGLRNQLAQGQAKLSADQLRASQDQRNFDLQTQKQAEIEKFHAQEIANSQQKIAQSAAGGGMGPTRERLGAQTQWLHDPILKNYTPRLDGAVKVLNLLDAAEKGGFKQNQSLLGQMNAEVSRLETGSQSPGLHASEKTELESGIAQLHAFIDKWKNGVSGVDLSQQFNQTRGLINDLQGSYLGQIRARHQEIKAGATDLQEPIFDAKQKAFEDNYASRIKGINLGTNNDGSPRGGPAVGDVVKGYKFKGGEAHDPANWEKVN
jgi:hypothetical protein